VADQVYVSQWHLSKLINRHTNQSFLDILNNLRIEKARQLLANSGLRIHEVALQCGYSDLGHFSRNFKKLTGVTPGEFRDSAVQHH
jgi:AraC-like DNA-binding protein